MIAPVIAPTFAYANTSPQFPTDKGKQYAKKIQYDGH